MSLPHLIYLYQISLKSDHWCCFQLGKHPHEHISLETTFLDSEAGETDIYTSNSNFNILMNAILSPVVYYVFREIKKKIY